MAFKQDTTEIPIRHFVVPIGSIIDGQFILQGTAFLVGENGHAITAAHVIDALQQDGAPVVLFADKANWHVVDLVNLESHPEEDVGIVQLNGGPWYSIIQISSNVEHSSCEYELWAYPETVAHELRAETANPNHVRPELIYDRGYVRRRITRQLPISIYRGKAFYELNIVSGACCSGAPIIKRNRKSRTWESFAIYVGENTADARAMVSYATRFDALVDWVPKILGQPIVNLKATHQ